MQPGTPHVLKNRGGAIRMRSYASSQADRAWPERAASGHPADGRGSGPARPNSTSRMQYPPDRGLAATVLERQHRHGLTIGVTLGDFLSLAVVEH
jgi:hypothetical protein